jgi:hypothetical protein
MGSIQASLKRYQDHRWVKTNTQINTDKFKWAQADLTQPLSIRHPRLSARRRISFSINMVVMGYHSPSLVLWMLARCSSSNRYQAVTWVQDNRSFNRLQVSLTNLSSTRLTCRVRWCRTDRMSKFHNLEWRSSGPSSTLTTWAGASLRPRTPSNTKLMANPTEPIWMLGQHLIILSTLKSHRTRMK